VNTHVKQLKSRKDNIKQKNADVTHSYKQAIESHDPQVKVQYHYPCVEGVDD